MASNLIAVEVAAGQSVVAQGHTWLGGMTLWLPADDVPPMEQAGIVVPIGSYIPPVFQG